MPPSTPCRASHFAAVAGLALIAAACSSGTNSPGDSAKASQGPASTGLALNPCSLLTSDQVAQAIGKQVDQGKAQSENLSESQACNWEMQATNFVCAKDITGVTLEIVEPPPTLKPQFPTAEAYYPQLMSTLKLAGNTVEELQDLGDAAFSSETATKKGYSVYARKDSVLLRVFSICGPPDKLRPALQGLMKEALAKI